MLLIMKAKSATLVARISVDTTSANTVITTPYHISAKQKFQLKMYDHSSELISHYYDRFRAALYARSDLR